MSNMARPKGPLPPRVYWTRRLLVVGLAMALVFGLSNLFGGEPEMSDGPTARPAVAAQRSPTSGVTPSVGSAASPKARPEKRKPQPPRTRTPLAMPTGPCDDADMQITPSAKNAYAGSDVAITLSLTTIESPACNWEVSASSVVVKLTSGSDRIWSTQDCPSVVETQQVVVRKGQPTKVGVVWSGQRSDDECSRTTLWAEPGYYHVSAAALGAEPQAEQFELQAPVRPTITKTPKPRKTPAEKTPAEKTQDQDRG